MKNKTSRVLAFIGIALGLLLTACSSMPSESGGRAIAPGSYMSGGAGHSPH